MNKHKYLLLTIFSILVIFMLTSTSCIQQKKLTLLQDLNTAQHLDSTKTSKIETEYKLKAKDEIYIRISSTDPKTYQFFNGGEATLTGTNLNSDLGLYLNSYMLDDSGSIILPVAGKISLFGLSLFESQSKIEDLLKSKYLYDVSVSIKLTGFKITILGEVKKPGKQIAYVTQMNILEAIALGGDLTDYGNREKVMIVREEKGVQKILFVNLLDRNIINDENFNLLPNDIIYIEALKAKSYGFSQVPYSVVLSSLTTIVALLTLLKK